MAQTRAGKGDTDGLDLSLEYPLDAAGTTQNVHILWTDLIAASDADTARRVDRFLRGRLDVSRMAAAADPALYRNRSRTE